MRIQTHIVQAFVDGDGGGNAAGVVLNADALTAEQKAQVAQAVGLSETAFVSASAVASVKVEFFTPTRQIAHCGHATVATFALCSQLGRLPDGEHTKESIDGILALRVCAGQVTMRQRFPTFTPVPLDTSIAQRALVSIGLAPAALAPGLQPVVARAGNAFLLLPVASEEALAQLQPDLEQIRQVSEELDLIGVYPYAPATSRPARQTTTRMFAPRYGIAEESATGTAAGPLGAFLLATGAATGDCLIEQGHFMPRPSPSLLSVRMEADGSGAKMVHVSGSGRLARTLDIDI